MVGFKYSIIRIKPVGAGLIRFFTLLWLVGTGLVLTAVEGSAQSIMRQDSLADYSDKVWWIVADTSASKLKRVSNIAVTQHVIDSIAVLRAVINTQKIDTFTISGDTLFASLETDGEPAKFVLLAPYLDNTDNQQVDTFEINANLLRLSIEDDAQGFQTVNLAPYLDNTDNQKIDTFLISGDTLFNSLETDGEPGKFVLLAPYLDNTDTQLTQEQVEDFAGTMVALGTGTHTGIAVTYQDATGDMDLIIDHDAATNFVAGEHILHSGVTITAGDALSGGGDISATRTIDLDPSEMPGQAPDLADILAYEDVTDAGIHSMTLTQLQTLIDTDTGTDDQKIDTFLISNDTLFVSLEADGEPGKFVLLAPYLDNTDTQLTQEQVEDFAGALVANATGTHTGIAVTYQDGTGDMDLIIDHDAATNFVAGEHILHSGVTITAGDALSGGGDISATRTIDLDPSEMPGQAPDLADILAYEDVTDAGIHSMTLTQLQTLIDTDTGTDDQKIDTFLISNDTLFVSLEADGEPGKFVLLAPYLDNTDTQLTQKQVEDFAGALVANATGTHTGIAVTYQDATGDMDLIIDHDAATNFLAGEHILHSGVTITAGDALSGGGDISATRTLDLDPSEMGAQAPDLADILPYEDVTDAGIHSMTLTQLQTTIDTDTQLTQEQVEDFAGAMVTGNTETLITVTYQDGDGTTDFAVDANLSNYTNDAGFLTSETDDQKIDTFLISGDTLFASLEADGESGKFVLLAPYLDNTDTQLSQEQVEDFAGAMVTGNTETLITVTYQDGDGTTDFAVDANLSNYTNDAGFLTSETDDQKIDTFLISGDTLFASLEADGESGKFVLLAPYLDNTDTQLSQEQVEDFAGAMVTGNTETLITVTYQDGDGTTDFAVDANLSNYTNDAGFLTSETDDQKIDTFLISGDTLFASLEADGESGKFVLLAPYLDNTDTQLSQEQVEDFAGAMVTGNTETLITVTYQDGDGTTDFAVDANLSNYTNDAGFLTSETDDQKIDTFLISGDTLFASLETDGEPAKFVLLSSYLDNTDTQLTQEQVEDFAGALVANGTGTHTGIAVTYQDATGHMDLIIDHDAATNFLAGEHILHSGVTITAGDALSGGGDISATRALDLDPSEMPGQAPAAADILVYEDVTDAGIHSMTITQLESIIDHGNLVGLGDDDHTIYPLLLGRATGQTLIGGTASGDDLTLESTSNATKGNVFIKSPELQSGAGLELLKFTGTASAVNEFTITNSITANDPILSATGGDANIGITLTPKGTGNIKLGTATWNADQALGSGQDEYPAVFDNGTGLVAYKQLNTAGIANDATTYDKIQNVVADQRLLGNIAGAGGIVAELTPEQVRVMLGLDEKDVSIQAWGDKTVVTIDSSLVVWKVGPEHDNVTIRELSWFSNSFGTSVDIQLVKNGTAVTLDGDNTYQISTADSTFNMTNLALTDGDRLQFKCTAVVGATTGLTFTLEGDYDAP